MKTETLIAALAADLPTAEPPTRRRLLPALALAFAASAVLLLATIGVREDLAAALDTLRFPLKFALTLALAGTALPVVLRLSGPLPAGRGALAPFLLPLGLLAAACLAELGALPASAWPAAAEGRYGLYCLLFVPGLSLVPLAATVMVLRRAAPSSPTLAGAAAGLLASGLGATVYAIHCTDDSPLFLAIWYGTATLLVTAAGAFAGRRWLTW